MLRQGVLIRPACLATSLVAFMVLSLQTIAPAVADQTAASRAAVTLEGGGLSISAPVDAGNLGTESNMVGAVTISGQLGQVQVTDSRGAPAGSGWTATAISTAFTQTAGPSRALLRWATPLARSPRSAPRPTRPMTRPR